MSTSLISGGGLVDFATSLYGAADDPLDTVLMRDAVAHGLLHAADSMAQARVAFHPVASAVATDQTSFETIEASPVTGQWYQVGATPFGPWPLTLRADGSGYKLRVRLGAAVSAVAGVATFRVVIGPARRLLSAEIDAAADHVYQATTASTTVAWLSGTTQSTASGTLMTVTASQARDWTSTESVYDAVSSGSPHSTGQCLVAAHVYAKTSDATSMPRLHALHISEFVGA